MFATIAVRKDDSLETLCFADKESAERFCEFVRVYQTDSGAGNGYGAYWIFDSAIGLFENPPRSATLQLEEERVRSMLDSILKARLADEQPPDLTVDLVIGQRGGAISFELGELPPRTRPSTGDMFRVIAPHGERIESEHKVGEGRVLGDHGETLEVVSNWGEESDGSIKENAERHMVRATAVMKINDWKRARR